MLGLDLFLRFCCWAASYPVGVMASWAGHVCATQRIQQSSFLALLDHQRCMQELKTVMEDLDGDLTDLFGEGDWTAVSDAIEATRLLRQPGAPLNPLFVPPLVCGSGCGM